MGIQSDFEEQVEQYGPAGLLAYRVARIESNVIDLESATEAGHRRSLLLGIRLHLQHLKLIANHYGYASLKPTGKELPKHDESDPA